MIHDLMGHKENDRLPPPPRKHSDDHPYFVIDDYNEELEFFMLDYKGNNPAWDFIQYLLNMKHLRFGKIRKSWK